MQDEMETAPAPPCPPEFRFGIPSEVLPNESFKPITREIHEAIDPHEIRVEYSEGQDNFEVDNSAWDHNVADAAAALHSLDNDDPNVSRPTTSESKKRVEEKFPQENFRV